jgi:DNA-directed RNA polymerase specialized sigma24 family protein
VPHTREWPDDANGLRRFGLALVRDDRFATDDSAAARLVDKLIRQTCVAPIAERSHASATDRAAAYARFVQLYRRHVRRMALDEDAAWNESPARGPSVVSGLRALPLELREALLVVSLARFTHAEAAEALDVPLSRLLERLERARCRLAAHMGVDVDAAASGWTGAAHLRVIK